MEPTVTVAAALDLARRRLAEAPSFAIYSSCVTQLEYLLAALQQHIPIDRPRLRQIIVGHYGAREFEASDPEFADALMEAQAIASKMAKGLTVP